MGLYMTLVIKWRPILCNKALEPMITGTDYNDNDSKQILSVWKHMIGTSDTTLVNMYLHSHAHIPKIQVLHPYYGTLALIALLSRCCCWPCQKHQSVSLCWELNNMFLPWVWQQTTISALDMAFKLSCVHMSILLDKPLHLMAAFPELSFTCMMCFTVHSDGYWNSFLDQHKSHALLVFQILYYIARLVWNLPVSLKFNFYILFACSIPPEFYRI